MICPSGIHNPLAADIAFLASPTPQGSENKLGFGI